MTLIVSVVTEQGIVLGADSLVATPHGLTQDEKIWLLGGRFGVLSYGGGPPGIPALIKSFAPTSGEVKGVAQELLALFRVSDAPICFHVAGHDHGELQVFRVDVANEAVLRLNWGPGGLCYDAWCGGVASIPEELTGGLEHWVGVDIQHMSLGDAVWRTEALIRRTVREYPRFVGPPTRLLVLEKP